MQTHRHEIQGTTEPHVRNFHQPDLRHCNPSPAGIHICGYRLFIHPHSDKEMLMKRHLNTSYRLVWNHITGAFVVASELARARGKRAGVAVALSLAAATSLPALAADSVVPAGETVNGGTLINHDRQFVSGTADGMTVSTGLELGADSDNNTGGQQIARGGTARNTRVTANGLQDVMAGGSTSDTVISTGGGQNLRGKASGTVLNGGDQWIHAGGRASGTVINQDGYQTIKHGGLVTGTIVNTGAEGGPDSENVSTGQMVGGIAESTTINKNGRQVIWSSGIARDTLIYTGGDQTVHGEAHNTRLEGGNQYVHKYGLALNTVINEGGWQVVKAGGTAGTGGIALPVSRHHLADTAHPTVGPALRPHTE